MNAHAIALRRGRTPGERAFDRALFPMALFAVPAMIAHTAMSLRSASHLLHSEAEPSASVTRRADLAWLPWLEFAVGLLLAILWLRALASLVRAWRDPSARVLRFSALALLVPFAALAYRLLLMPWP